MVKDNEIERLKLLKGLKRLARLAGFAKVLNGGKTANAKTWDGLQPHRGVCFSSIESLIRRKI